MPEGSFRCEGCRGALIYPRSTLESGIENVAIV
jgi:hypothetical protein